MDIRQLKTFLTIASLNSFTKAAQALDYAQSTITTQIQTLEQEFGVKLFERLGHRITLTSAGHDLLPYAQQAVKVMDEAKKAIRESQEIGGLLTIGTVESLCVERLPRLLKEYKNRYPHVELILKFGGTADFVSAIKDNTVDIAFFLDKLQTLPDLITELQKPEQFGLFASSDDPITGCTEVRPEDLTGKTLILTEPACSYRTMFETKMAEFKIKPQSVIETGNVHTIKQLVMSGMGVTLLPLSAISDECKEGRLVKLNWKGPVFELHIQVIRHKSKWISPQLNAFIQLLLEMGF